MKLALALILIFGATAMAAPSNVDAANCEGVAEYVASMESAIGPYLKLLADQPALLEQSPSQMTELARETDAVAEAYRAISPPDIAIEYHMAAIAGMQSWANFLRDAATLGVFTAALLHFGEEESTGDPITFNEHQGLLAQRCVDFQPFLVWLNTYPDDPTSPVASPIR